MVDLRSDTGILKSDGWNSHWWKKREIILYISTSQFPAQTAPALEHIAWDNRYWGVPSLQAMCVCIEAGLRRRRPKPPAGPPKFRYLQFTGCSGPKFVILPSSENADFKRISSILLPMDRPWCRSSFWPWFFWDLSLKTSESSLVYLRSDTGILKSDGWNSHWWRKRGFFFYICTPQFPAKTAPALKHITCSTTVLSIPSLQAILLSRIEP